MMTGQCFETLPCSSSCLKTGRLLTSRTMNTTDFLGSYILYFLLISSLHLPYSNFSSLFLSWQAVPFKEIYYFLVISILHIGRLLDLQLSSLQTKCLLFFQPYISSCIVQSSTCSAFPSFGSLPPAESTLIRTSPILKWERNFRYLTRPQPTLSSQQYVPVTSGSCLVDCTCILFCYIQLQVKTISLTCRVIKTRKDCRSQISKSIRCITFKSSAICLMGQ